MELTGAQMGFRRAYDNTRSVTSKISKFVFELSSAQNELKRGSLDERKLGGGSTATFKVSYSSS